jgi:hypothetical protein
VNKPNKPVKSEKIPKDKGSVKGKEEQQKLAPPSPQVPAPAIDEPKEIQPKTSKEVLDEFMETLVLELSSKIAGEMSGEIADLKQKNELLAIELREANRKLLDLQQNNYVISKNGTATFSLPFSEFGKNIIGNDSGFIVSKILLAEIE